MVSEPDVARKNVQSWIEQLSAEQFVLIDPIFQALHRFFSEQSPSVDSNAVSTPRLLYETLEQNIESCLRSLDDRETVESTLQNCLELIQAEKLSGGGELAEIPEGLTGNSAYRSTMKSYPLPPTADAVTGLPGRMTFQRIVANALTEGREAIIALFAVERLAYLNKRFGRGAGDEILLFVAQYLAQELSDSSSLSRWGGPAFAALVCSPNLKRSAMQMRAISAKQLSKSIDRGGKASYCLSLVLAW